MNYTLNLEAPWEEVKERLMEINYELTDEDLDYDPAKPALLLDKLSKKMNKSPEEIKSWIESVSYNKGIAS